MVAITTITATPGTITVPVAKKTNDMIVVVFQKDGDNIMGKIQKDKKRRNKIVFVNGYHRHVESIKAGKKNVLWTSPLPDDGERWLVDVVHDNKPKDPERGALFVRLQKNLTAEEKAVQRAEEMRLAPIVALGFKVEEAQVIEKIAAKIRERKLFSQFRDFASAKSLNVGVNRLSADAHRMFKALVLEANKISERPEMWGITHKMFEAAVMWLGLESTDAAFIPQGKRWYVCICGTATRARKGANEVQCDACGRRAVLDEAKDVEQKKVALVEMAAAMQQKWNGK
ncbi:MAG: hypothetical protein WC310_04665 [Patescibacteria group bacterium]|jgi:hypothetical protein